MSIHRSDEWLREQLLTIGSTAAGVIANESPYGTPAELYDSMIRAQEGTLLPTEINDDMRRGIMTEPLHRQLLEDALGVKVHEHDQDRFLTSEQHPFAHALPDGWILASGEYIPVQLKCPRSRGWHEIKLKGLHSHWLIGTQHSLAITGAAYEHFSVLNVELMRLIHFPVYRDDELIEQIMKMEQAFYASFLERVRPNEDQQPQLKLPPTDGKVLMLDGDDALDAAQSWVEANNILNDAQSILEEAKTRLKEMMGDATVAELPGLRVYHIPQAGRKTFDKEKMKKDGIILDKYEKQGKPFNTFRVYKLGK